MTDYNDGEWHFWDSAEAPPVHPKSKVDWLLKSELKNWDFCKTIPVEAAHLKGWDEMFAFRVVTPYVEPVKPREWWVNVREGSKQVYLHGTWEAADFGRRNMHGEIVHGYGEPILVREVIE